MTSFQSILLIIFSVIAYMMFVDENVKDFVNLLSKILNNEIRKKIWIIQNDPRNPLINLIKRWEYGKIAKELQKEFNSKQK